ncbi:MAG: hypothetical protein K2X28_05600 [Alphaproteobacteria bacterium]|nr:hypothetical protein [Alphaproteobacteria bacterium]
MGTKKNSTVRKKYPLKYQGNLVIFVLSLILFFPLAFVLAMKNGVFLKNNVYYSFSYNGSYGWLIFWTLLFFPVAIVLGLINGIDLVEEKRSKR